MWHIPITAETSTGKLCMFPGHTHHSRPWGLDPMHQRHPQIRPSWRFPASMHMLLKYWDNTSILAGKWPVPWPLTALPAASGFQLMVYKNWKLNSKSQSIRAPPWVFPHLLRLCLSSFNHLHSASTNFCVSACHGATICLLFFQLTIYISCILSKNKVLKFWFAKLLIW